MFKKSVSDALKYSFDRIVSVLLLLLIFPIGIVVALLIKINDGGPIFYMGMRAGKGGVPFRMFKFRSMIMNADKLGGPSTSDNDPRLTMIGKFLRKSKLDEIPQLINVLKGQMSLVGPRPEVPQYVALFTEEEKKILSVRPGITDWASLWDFDEGALLAGSQDPEKTYLEKIRPEKIRLQLKYINEMSFLTDLKIIGLTVLKVFGRSAVRNG